MDHWHETATAEIDDIDGWRGHEGQRPNTPTTWWQDEPDLFQGQTSLVIAWIANRHPGMDVKPFSDIYEAVSIWHEEHSAANIVGQSTLRRWMNRAIDAMTVAKEAIFDRSKAKPAAAQAGQAAPAPMAATPSAEQIIEIHAARLGITGKDIALFTYLHHNPNTSLREATGACGGISQETVRTKWNNWSTVLGSNPRSRAEAADAHGKLRTRSNTTEPEDFHNTDD